MVRAPLSSSGQLHLTAGEIDHPGARLDLDAGAALEREVARRGSLDRDVAGRLERQRAARARLLDRDRTARPVLLVLDRRRRRRSVARDRQLLVDVVEDDADLVVLGAD